MPDYLAIHTIENELIKETVENRIARTPKSLVVGNGPEPKRPTPRETYTVNSERWNR